jgi:hypothetical protein
MFENYLVAMPVFVSRLRLREQFQKIFVGGLPQGYLLVAFPRDICWCKIWMMASQMISYVNCSLVMAKLPHARCLYVCNHIFVRCFCYP